MLRRKTELEKLELQTREALRLPSAKSSLIELNREGFPKLPELSLNGLKQPEGIGRDPRGQELSQTQVSNLETLSRSSFYLALQLVWNNLLKLSSTLLETTGVEGFLKKSIDKARASIESTLEIVKVAPKRNIPSFSKDVGNLVEIVIDQAIENAVREKAKRAEREERENRLRYENLYSPDFGKRPKIGEPRAGSFAALKSPLDNLQEQIDGFDFSELQRVRDYGNGSSVDRLAKLDRELRKTYGIGLSESDRSKLGKKII